jgi:integrase
MAAIRERGGRFHVQVRMTGFPARTATFPTRRQAERWGKTVEAEMIEGKHFRSVEARRRTLGEAIKRYLEEEAPGKKDAKTRTARLRWWDKRLGQLKLAEVTAAVLVEQRNKLTRETYTRSKPGAPGSTLKEGEAPRELKRSPQTANRYLAYLSHVFTIARKEWHWISHDPFDGVGKFKEGAGRVRYLSDEERAALLTETANDPQLHTLVVLALSTAARAGELLGLSWRDIDLKDGRALLRKTKNSQPRTAWLHGEALKLLKEHGRVRRLDDDRVFRSVKGKRYDYRDGFENACERAGIKDFTFHGLRHSAATYLARAGATEQQLKAIGGWKSNVVSRYVHLAAEDARAVLEKMNNKILGDGK